MTKKKKVAKKEGILEKVETKVNGTINEAGDFVDKHHFTRKTIKGVATMGVSYEIANIAYPIAVAVLTQITHNPDVFPEEFKMIGMILCAGILSGLQNWWNHKDD